MAKLYFRYGLGKSAQLCQVAYNYINERNMNIAIINAKDNGLIQSRVVVDGKSLLQKTPNVSISGETSLYDKLYYEYISSYGNMSCVLVDNAEYLSVGQAEDLFYFSKLLDIPVIAYGNRVMPDNSTSFGGCRLMALADNIEKIDNGLATKMATLDYIYGAMNCSKTAQMLTKNQALLDAGYNTCLVKPVIDRDAVYITSRIGLKKKADIILGSDDSIYGQAEYLYRDRVNQILVDEAQFLSINQINQLRKIVNDYNIPVVCYGLRSDFLSNLFPGSQRLLELSDNIYKMKTVCSCGHGAEFNVRIDSNGNYVTQGEQVCVDNGGNYDSECPYCFMEHVMGIDIHDENKEKVRKKINI